MDIQLIKNRFGIIGNSPALNYALQVAAQVANTDLTVLIMGESGVGKEAFSNIIHSLSNRKHNPFIAVNCGAIRREQSIPNCLGTKKDHSQGLLIHAKVISRR
ncbi:MAG: sigma-54 factor interaction domain-containing protein [Chitinophagaceae bacterium]|nr:sigma-54 factor interaction domain-containing protein [Chitinophagaceae bacterium]